MSDERQFINARIGGSLLDFEDTISSETTFSTMRRNWVRGVVGELPPNPALNISMMWETGESWVSPVEALTCSFDNSTCYVAKSVPVIFNMSQNTGYSSGGMNLTVTGYGFNSENIDAKVDGQDCIVTRFNDYEFDCYVTSKVLVADDTEADDSAAADGAADGLRRRRMQDTTTTEGTTTDDTTTDGTTTDDTTTDDTTTDGTTTDGTTADTDSTTDGTTTEDSTTPTEEPDNEPVAEELPSITLEESGLYVGQWGMKNKYIGETINWNNFDNYDFVWEYRSEASLGVADRNGYTGNIMNGWFVPPATTRYKFFLSCGSNCIMRIGDYANQKENKTQHARVGSYSPYNQYKNKDRAAESTSEWISMTKDEHYYIEAYHTDTTGWKHLQIAIEIEATQPPIAEEGEE